MMVKVQFDIFFFYLQQIKELNQYLEAERSSRTDLEMYVAVLNTQKGSSALLSFLHVLC